MTEFGGDTLQGRDVLPKPDARLKRAFGILRQQVHAQQQVELPLRIGTPLSEFEMRIGRLTEQFEPQVRGVLQVMNQKGYDTTGSGFSAVNVSEQSIFGAFGIKDATKGVLHAMGVRVREEKGPVHMTEIAFFPAAADMKKMTATWDSIGEVLPTIGESVVYDKAEEFQRFWAEELAEASDE